MRQNFSTDPVKFTEHLHILAYIMGFLQLTRIDTLELFISETGWWGCLLFLCSWMLDLKLCVWSTFFCDYQFGEVENSSQVCSLVQMVELGFAMEPADNPEVRQLRGLIPLITQVMFYLITYRYPKNMAFWTLDPLQMEEGLAHRPFHNSYLQNLQAEMKRRNIKDKLITTKW